MQQSLSASLWCFCLFVFPPDGKWFYLAQNVYNSFALAPALLALDSWYSSEAALIPSLLLDRC